MHRIIKLLMLATEGHITPKVYEKRKFKNHDLL